MVEAGRIDHAAHANDLARVVPEVLELDQVVSEVVGDSNIMAGTLVIVTADHETGGLSVLESTGTGKLPTVRWSTDYHTAINVPLYATGVSARWMGEVSDNTEIFQIMVRLFALQPSE